MERFNKKVARLFAVILMTVSALAMSIATPALAGVNGTTDLGAYTCRYYTIRRGDTLTRISNLFGVSIRTLMLVNGLRTTRIYSGRRLCIPVYTQPSPQPVPTGPWYGEYWNNNSQSGAPSLVRYDAAVNFNWGFGTPDPGRIFADNFSARWTRSLNFVAGTYRFSLTADDGIRLVIDGNVVFDRFTYVGNQTNQVDVAISGGVHTVRIDYAEQAWQQLAIVSALFTLNLAGNAAMIPALNLPDVAGHSLTDNQTLIQWLHERDIHHLFADYWIGYWVSFDSGGSIVPSIIGPGNTVGWNRYVPYAIEVDESRAPAYVYVTGGEEARAFEVYLRREGIAYQATPVSIFTVYWPVTARVRYPLAP